MRFTASIVLPATPALTALTAAVAGVLTKVFKIAVAVKHILEDTAVAELISKIGEIANID